MRFALIVCQAYESEMVSRVERINSVEQEETKATKDLFRCWIFSSVWIDLEDTPGTHDVISMTGW